MKHLRNTVILLLLALTACGAKGTMSAEDNAETGGVDVVCQKAGDGTAVSGYVTIEEGQCLVLSPNLEKGSIQIRASMMEREATASDLGIGDEVALDETVSGRVMSTYDLEPGEYMLGIIAKDNPTGTLVILPYSVEDIQAQDEALAEELGQLDADLQEILEQ